MTQDDPGRPRVAVDADPEQEGAVRAADEMLAAERYHAALAAYRRTVHPTAAVYSGIAAAYAGLADFQRAAEAARQALARAPEEARALAVTGYLADVADRAPQQALALLRQAVAADPRSAYAHYRLGEFLLKYEHFDAARAALEEAARLGPDNWRVALALSRFAPTPRAGAAQALEARRAGLRRNPGDPRLRLGLLWALARSPLARSAARAEHPSTETARRQHLALQALFSRPFQPLLTYAILAVNAVMFGVLEWQAGWQDPSDATLVRFGAMYGPYVHAAANVLGSGGPNDWWRLFTPMVLHANLVHFGMNSLFLWVMGPLTERLFGRPRMLVIYLVAGVCGNLASYLHNPDGLSVGASTALFGLLGALGVFFWWSRGLLGSFGRRQFQSIVITAVLNLAFDQVVPVIDTAAHVGGLIGGVVVGVALLPRYTLEDDGATPAVLRDRRAPATLLASTAALIAVLAAVIKFTVYR